MSTSQAQIEANRRNAQRSTGPRTAEGKEQSRRNGLKHGLSGAGIVLAPEDADAVERRNEALQAELNPRTTLGEALVRKIATLSIRMERSATQETAAIARRVNHAPDDFDNERFDEAERLFDLLGEEPRINLRKLRKSPEGVDRLILAWQVLRDDLQREPRPLWTAGHLERAKNLTGSKMDEAQGSTLNNLSKALWGDFGIPGNREDEEFGIGNDSRKALARQQLIERIDSEIVDLEAHYETLDFELIELDRAQAGDIALFDPSKAATLARRYESEASRGFFQAIKELRQVEAEALERPAQPAKPATPPAHAQMASSWAGPATPRDSQPVAKFDSVPTTNRASEPTLTPSVTAGPGRIGLG
jgi:hypothetical protein